MGHLELGILKYCTPGWNYLNTPWQICYLSELLPKWWSRKSLCRAAQTECCLMLYKEGAQVLHRAGWEFGGRWANCLCMKCVLQSTVKWEWRNQRYDVHLGLLLEFPSINHRGCQLILQLLHGQQLFWKPSIDLPKHRDRWTLGWTGKADWDPLCSLCSWQLVARYFGQGRSNWF